MFIKSKVINLLTVKFPTKIRNLHGVFRYNEPQVSIFHYSISKKCKLFKNIIIVEKKMSNFIYVKG